MKMRDLETRTGVNRETIRVYLRHGLVPEPSRPKPNVADYDESHVRAIAAVRDLQRDSRLTLNQIKAVLEGEHSEHRIEAGAFHNLEALVATRVGVDDRQVTVESLVKLWPQAREDAAAFAAMGMIDIIETRKGPALSVTDSRILNIWGEMRASGYSDQLGFTPDILAFYKEPVEMVARQESTLFLERVEGKLDEQEAAALFQAGMRLMIDFFGLLRTKALLRYLHRYAETGQEKPERLKAKGPPKKAG
ncbi:MerR family transcriptional regulator [Sphingopyxis sp.]|uniref:MerR family transcriptional regulator n=1 Tax=Sphingopyxis sp. TaxID=1908224 RepID=UPI003D0BC65C